MCVGHKANASAQRKPLTADRSSLLCLSPQPYRLPLTPHRSPLTASHSPLPAHRFPLTASRSPLLAVLVVPPEPDSRLIAAPGCPVQPLVHPPQRVQAPGISRIGVVDHAVLQRERAHAGTLAGKGGDVGAGPCRHPLDSALTIFRFPLSPLLPHQRVPH